MNNELVIIVKDLGGSDIYLGGGVFPLSSAIKLSYSLSSWNKGNWNMLKYARVRHASLIVKIRVPDPPVQVRPICQGGRFLALFQEALDALVCRPYSPQLCAQHHHTFADFLSRTKDMMLLSTPKYIKLTLCKQCCWWRLVCPGTAKTDGLSHHNSCTAATEWYFNSHWYISKTDVFAAWTSFE